MSIFMALQSPEVYCLNVLLWEQNSVMSEELRICCDSRHGQDMILNENKSIYLFFVLNHYFSIQCFIDFYSPFRCVFIIVFIKTKNISSYFSV